MISVVITTYGRPKYLKRSIKSVLNQTYKNFELIIVDDNGLESKYSQETIENVEEFRPYIKFIQHKTNKGANKARNTGIKNSRGDYIAFLDDDDMFFENKLEEINRVIKSNKDVDLIYSGANHKNENSNKNKYRFVCSEKLENDILEYNFIGSNSFAVVKRKKLEEINFFDEQLESCQDWDMWIRIIHSKGTVVGIDKALVEYTIHQNENRISKNKDKSIDGHRKLFEKCDIYLKKFSIQKRNEIKANQEKRIAMIEYNFENFREYRKIIKNNKKYLRMSLKDKIRFLFSYLSIGLIDNSIKVNFFKKK